MALTDAYATVAEYKDRLGRSDNWAEDGARDAVLLAQLTGVSRWMERKLGRFFTKEDSATTRIYQVPREQSNNQILKVDDMSVAPTSVIIDLDYDGDFDAPDAVMAGADWEAIPLNAALDPEPQPYTALRCTPWGSQGLWPVETRIQVTCAWGWPAVPDAIKDVCVELTGMLRLDSGRSTSRISEGLDAVIRTSLDAQRLINDLQKAYKHPRSYFG